MKSNQSLRMSRMSRVPPRCLPGFPVKTGDSIKVKGRRRPSSEPKARARGFHGLDAGRANLAKAYLNHSFAGKLGHNILFKGSLGMPPTEVQKQGTESADLPGGSLLSAHIHETDRGVLTLRIRLSQGFQTSAQATPTNVGCRFAIGFVPSSDILRRLTSLRVDAHRHPPCNAALFMLAPREDVK